MHYVVVKRRLKGDVESSLIIGVFKKLGVIFHRDGFDEIVVLVIENIVNFEF